MIKYIVWSTVFSEDRETSADVIETRRTDRKVAELDAAIFKDTFHRRAWINEEGAP